MLCYQARKKLNELRRAIKAEEHRQSQLAANALEKESSRLAPKLSAEQDQAVAEEVDAVAVVVKRAGISTVLLCWYTFKGDDDRQPVSSVGRAPDYCAGGQGFNPWPDHHSGS